MPKNGYPLPTVINPARYCVKLSIPNDPAHVAAFWGQITELGNWWTWARDDSHKARDVAAVWRDVFLNPDPLSCWDGQIWDLRQTGILLERQNTPGGLWSTLYDPSQYVVLKNPSPSLPNIINGIASQPALWIKGQELQSTLIVQHMGVGGSPLLVVNTHADNDYPAVQINNVNQLRPIMRLHTGETVVDAINQYGQITTRRYAETLPPANLQTYGSIIYLQDSANPVDYPNGAYIGSYSLDGYFWARFKGEAGRTPIVTMDLGLSEWWNIAAAGITVKNTASAPDVDWLLTLPTPFLADQTYTDTVELTPAESPFVQFIPHIDPLLDDRYVAFQFGLPRAPQVYFLPTIIGEPGSDPALASSLDTNGDTAVQATLPAPYPAYNGCDTVPPNEGQTKTYYGKVSAHDGMYIPFLVPGGCTLESVTPAGLWGIFEPAPIIGGQEFVSDADGYGAASPKNGTLMVGAMLPTEETFDYFPYTDMPFSVESDTWLKFKQQRADTRFVGQGALCVEYVISRAQSPGRWRIHADVGENCVVNAPIYLGNDRWRITGQETTGNPAQPGRIAITIWDHDAVPPVPAACWHAANADFVIWTPAGSHNQMIPGSCSSPPNTQVDFSDEGAAWMNSRNSMERFDLKFISGNVQIEFDAIKD